MLLIVAVVSGMVVGWFQLVNFSMYDIVSYMYGIVSVGQVMSSQPFRTFLCFFSPCAAGRERFHQGDPPFVANSVQCTCNFGEPQQVIKGDTIDGRNPAPVDMVDIPSFTGFYTSQVVQDFFHQQYHHYKWPYEIL